MISLAHGVLGAVEMIGVLVLGVACFALLLVLVVGVLGLVIRVCSGRGY